MLKGIQEFLGIPELPTTPEVLETLSNQVWRTRWEVRRRLEAGYKAKTQKTFYEGPLSFRLGMMDRRIRNILNDLEYRGVIISINSENLPDEEITASDDEAISRWRIMSTIVTPKNPFPEAYLRRR